MRRFFWLVDNILILYLLYIENSSSCKNKIFILGSLISGTFLKPFRVGSDDITGAAGRSVAFCEAAMEEEFKFPGEVPPSFDRVVLHLLNAFISCLSLPF